MRLRRRFRDYDSPFRKFLTYKQANLLEMLEEAGWLASSAFNKIASSRAGRWANLRLMLYRLRAQGFVESRKEQKRRGNEWRITDTGTRLLDAFRRHTVARVASNVSKDHVKIVIFDIPEEKKWARAWIRQTLQHLRFKLLQKSVWIGDAKLPEEFFASLVDYEIDNFVHVFAVAKRGSISGKYFESV